jgi:hypothetical protein
MKPRAFGWIAALATTGEIWLSAQTPGTAQAPAAGELPSKAGNANSFANLNLCNENEKDTKHLSGPARRP